MSWKNNQPCPTCGRYASRALEDWRAAALVACMERARAMPRGPERTERIRNVIQDFGVCQRTAQRYVKRARAA